MNIRNLKIGHRLSGGFGTSILLMTIVIASITDRIFCIRKIIDTLASERSLRTLSADRFQSC